MKKKLIYTLVFFCTMSLFASAKQLCTECPKKCCHKAATEKKQPVKKKVTTSIRPLNFYLFNI
jgi:hypothetical protein